MENDQSNRTTPNYAQGRRPGKNLKATLTAEKPNNLKLDLVKNRKLTFKNAAMSGRRSRCHIGKDSWGEILIPWGYYAILEKWGGYIN